jgi:hypothetical protein
MYTPSPCTYLVPSLPLTLFYNNGFVVEQRKECSASLTFDLSVKFKGMYFLIREPKKEKRKKSYFFLVF